MKICIFWYQEKVWGGVDTHLLTLLKYWSHHDKITILTNPQNHGLHRIKDHLKLLPNVKCVASESVNRINFPQKLSATIGSGLLNIIRHLCKPIFFWRMTAHARKLFKIHGPFDALIADNGGYPGAWGCLAAIIAAKQLNIPKRLLLVHHGAGKPSLLLQTFEFIVDSMISKYASDLVAVSLATRQSLIDYRYFNPELNPIRVIYNAVEQLNNEINISKFNIRKKFNLDDKILIGMVGRLERYKGHEDLITGFSLLTEEQKRQITIVFIGVADERETERITKLSHFLQVENSIIFTGPAPDPIQETIAQLDMLASMTKDFEGFGLTIAEAMSVNVPVMATNVGAVPELINNHVGTLIPPESPEIVREILEQFILDRKHFTNKTAAAKNHVARFNPTRMAKHFELLIHN